MTMARDRGFVQSREATKRNHGKSAFEDAIVRRAPAETSSELALQWGVLLHWASVEHVEHAGISRAAASSIIAHEVVDAHAWPRASSLRCGWRCPAVAAGWWRLQRRVVVWPRSCARCRGRIGMWG